MLTRNTPAYTAAVITALVETVGWALMKLVQDKSTVEQACHGIYLAQ
jgi:hypothetical protein